jgi:hypothetical protein
MEQIGVEVNPQNLHSGRWPFRIAGGLSDMLNVVSISRKMHIHLLSNYYLQILTYSPFMIIFQHTLCFTIYTVKTESLNSPLIKQCLVFQSNLSLINYDTVTFLFLNFCNCRYRDVCEFSRCWRFGKKKKIL